jgi:hypothetical protein
VRAMTRPGAERSSPLRTPGNPQIRSIHVAHLYVDRRRDAVCVHR